MNPPRHVLVSLGLMLQSQSQDRSGSFTGASRLPYSPFSSAEMAQPGREGPQGQSRLIEVWGGRQEREDIGWDGTFSRCMPVLIFEVQE